MNSPTLYRDTSAPALYRDISFLETPKVSEKDGLKTVNFSFASETPYVRMDWSRWELVEETLKCSAEAIQGQRLENGLIQFLWNHNIDAVRGVITSIDWRDAKGYAEAKFSRSPAAEQLYQDIQDEIIKGISLMYRVYEYEILEKAVYSGTGWDAELISPEKVRAISWEIFEISAVTIPADATVGIGRSIGRSLRDFDHIPTTVPQLIKTIGLRKIKEAIKDMTDQKDDIRRSSEYIELDNKYRESQALVNTLTSERDALKSQVNTLQSELNEQQKKAKLTEKYVNLKSQADALVTEAKMTGHEHTELFGRSLEELLKDEDAGAELRAIEIFINSASKRAAVLNTKKSQVPAAILDDPEMEDLQIGGEERSTAAQGYENAHKPKRN